ncbi:MAG TPA: AzlD domain-containing protein, partial [Beijerinckiaceae bacterium]|nr:AzlD domain-containing protein [Beijerinckiaceae bacterium]
AGPYLAIAAMTAATFFCRASGVMLMSRIRITRRVTRALRALPGSIVVATVLPIALHAGPPAILGLVAGLTTMTLVRHELAALIVGLAAVSLARATGL